MWLFNTYMLHYKNARVGWLKTFLYLYNIHICADMNNDLDNTCFSIVPSPSLSFVDKNKTVIFMYENKIKLFNF